MSYRRLMKKYQIGKYLIDIPDEHLLPTYQAEHSTYDKFLPYLLKEIRSLPNDSICIVGSNIGDTLAALCDVRPEFTYLNFEADSDFFTILDLNSKLIREISNTHIVNVCCFVGKDAKVNSLIGEGGTKHAVLAKSGELNEISLVSLDSALPNYLNGRLKLLIIDVDGFDWDVLNSAKSSIQKDKPVIFFELYTSDEETLFRYITSIKNLENLGYQFSIFDNFGNLMTEQVGHETVESLARYVFSQNGNATRTIFYLDILATTKKNCDLTNVALSNFRSYIFN